MAKVIKEDKPFEVEVKRFYMDGFKVVSDCPNCSMENILDLSQNYLMYPTANEKFLETVYCEVCDTEYDVGLVLRVDLEAV